MSGRHEAARAAVSRAMLLKPAERIMTMTAANRIRQKNHWASGSTHRIGERLVIGILFFPGLMSWSIRSFMKLGLTTLPGPATDRHGNPVANDAQSTSLLQRPLSNHIAKLDNSVSSPKAKLRAASAYSPPPRPPRPLRPCRLCLQHVPQS